MVIAPTYGACSVFIGYDVNVDVAVDVYFTVN